MSLISCLSNVCVLFCQHVLTCNKLPSITKSSRVSLLQLFSHSEPVLILHILLNIWAQIWACINRKYMPVHSEWKAENSFGVYKVYRSIELFWHLNHSYIRWTCLNMKFQLIRPFIISNIFWPPTSPTAMTLLVYPSLPFFEFVVVVDNNK